MIIMLKISLNIFGCINYGSKDGNFLFVAIDKSVFFADMFIYR
jgi:hypothetical protein